MVMVCGISRRFNRALRGEEMEYYMDKRISRVRRFDSATSSLRPLVTAPFSATIARQVSSSNS
ncbi:hypothetical protein PanWU01x14_369570, partial [Parasponia andersonii]